MKNIVKAYICKDKNCEYKQFNNIKHFHAQYFCETNGETIPVAEPEIFWSSTELKEFLDEAQKVKFEIDNQVQ